MREAFISVADVLQAQVVEQDFLHDEGCHSLGQFAARLHNAQAQRNDFSGEQESNDFVLVNLISRVGGIEAQGREKGCSLEEGSNGFAP